MVQGTGSHPRTCKVQTHRAGPSGEQKPQPAHDRALQCTLMGKKKPGPRRQKGTCTKPRMGRVPGKRDRLEVAGLLGPGAYSSETVNLALLPAKTAVPRTLRLLVAQSFHFL